ASAGRASGHARGDCRGDPVSGERPRQLRPGRDSAGRWRQNRSVNSVAPLDDEMREPDSPPVRAVKDENAGAHDVTAGAGRPKSTSAALIMTAAKRTTISATACRPAR